MPTRNLAEQLSQKTKEDSNTENKISRQQVSKVIKINLSVSRVRKILDKENINVNIERAVANLKDSHDNKTKINDETQSLVDQAYDEVYEPRKAQHQKLVETLSKKRDAASKKRLKGLVPFPGRSSTVEEQTELVSKLRHRFSNDSSVALTSVLDYVVQDLAKIAIVNARSVYKSIIKVEHVILNKLEDSTVYPLLRNLPVVLKVMSEQPVEEEETEVKEESDTTGPNFDFYVHEICKQVRAELVEQDDNYKTIRISREIRQFGSRVVIELIERLSPLIKLHVQNTKVKTINDGVVKFVVQFLFTDANVDSTDLFTFVEEKLELYRHRKD